MNQIPDAPRADPSAQNVSSSVANPSTTQPRIRRRNRMITSCLECRRRKLKCDKSHPCTNCTKFTRDCIFLAPALDTASQLKFTEIKEKVGSLERLLQVPQQSTPQTEDNCYDDLPANEDENDLEPSPLASADAVYEVHGEDDGLLDLGISLGKMRITERIGGFFRPRLSEELGLTMAKPVKTKPNDVSKYKMVPLPPTSEWLKPSPAYIMPSSGFFFGTGDHRNSLIDFLPSRLAADGLIKQYFDCVHPLCQIVHRPTFEREYDTFWDEVSLGIEPPCPVQTIVFSAMFNGVVSMDEAAILRDFGVGKASMLDNFKLGTETALSRANFLRTTKVETLQAFVMYLIPLCRAEVSRAHSVLVGAAIRMAECMGLHRDGTAYGMNPLETHIRRLIWHQLCFLDIRTCESQGPRPNIRRNEYDTELPINANDSEFHASGPPPASADHWTDSTLSLIRFEVNQLTRTIWIDRPRLESRKISLTAVLSKIETFRANMARKYDHLMDDRIPIQKCAKTIKTLIISRCYVMVLHRYHHQVVSPMPDRLRTIVLSSGTTQLEMSILLGTNPTLAPWSWYIGALDQYHTAFLILIEVFTFPNRNNLASTDRMWTCLDYVFETSPEEPRDVKAMKILSEMQQKTAVYQSMRGMRAPEVMKEYPEAWVQGKEKGSKMLDKIPGNLLERSGNKPPVVTVGKMAVPAVVEQQDEMGGRGGMQFAGVSNGESLWALPDARSPGSGSDGASVADGLGPLASVPVASVPASGGGNGGDDLMADIDWDAFDALFPPENVDFTGWEMDPQPFPSYP